MWGFWGNLWEDISSHRLRVYRLVGYCLIIKGEITLLSCAFQTFVSVLCKGWWLIPVDVARVTASLLVFQGICQLCCTGAEGEVERGVGQENDATSSTDHPEMKVSIPQLFQTSLPLRCPHSMYHNKEQRLVQHNKAAQFAPFSSFHRSFMLLCIDITNDYKTKTGLTTVSSS